MTARHVAGGAAFGGGLLSCRRQAERQTPQFKPVRAIFANSTQVYDSLAGKFTWTAERVPS